MRTLKFVAVILLVLNYTLILSQETRGIIEPGKSFTNNSDQKLVVISMEDFDKLLLNSIKFDLNEKRVELLREQIKTLEYRVFYADSAITLKRLEAQFWHNKLLENDRTLENTRINLATTKDELQRTRRQRFRFLMGGFVSGIATSAIAVIAVKVAD